jgi:hypothetical protein
MTNRHEHQQHKLFWLLVCPEADNASWNPETCIGTLEFIHVGHAQHNLVPKMPWRIWCRHAASQFFWDGDLFTGTHKTLVETWKGSIRLCWWGGETSVDREDNTYHIPPR